MSVLMIMKDMDRNVFNIYYNTDGAFGEFVKKELTGSFNVGTMPLSDCGRELLNLYASTAIKYTTTRRVSSF